MNWFKSIGVAEIIFISLFLIFYLLYILRVVRISRVLNTSFRNVITKVVIRTLYFSLFIIALLGPSFGESSREIKSVGKDIYVAIDLSQSMNAYDIQPSRLEKVKFELKNVVDAFAGDRIGLIIFSSEAFVQCPLTYDQNALNLFIETMHTGLVPRTGTDFAPPLKMALKKLTSDDDSGTSQPKSRIVILISDGEDFGDSTEEMAEELNESGVRVFTLGVGTASGSKLKIRGGFKTDNAGKEVVSRLNAGSMKELAARTGGKYFEISETSNDISRLINYISLLEGEVRDTRKVDVSNNKYFYFLIAALMLMAFDLLISLRTVRI